MPKHYSDLILLSDGARIADTSYEVFRRAIARLGAGRKGPDGRVKVSENLAQMMKAERKRSGYLHPRGATLSDFSEATPRLAQSQP